MYITPNFPCRIKPPRYCTVVVLRCHKPSLDSTCYIYTGISISMWNILWNWQPSLRNATGGSSFGATWEAHPWSTKHTRESRSIPVKHVLLLYDHLVSFSHYDTVSSFTKTKYSLPCDTALPRCSNIQHTLTVINVYSIKSCIPTLYCQGGY